MGTERVLDLVAMARTGKGGGGGESDDASGGRGGGRGGVGADDGKGGAMMMQAATQRCSRAPPRATTDATEAEAAAAAALKAEAAATAAAATTTTTTTTIASARSSMNSASLSVLSPEVFIYIFIHPLARSLHLAPLITFTMLSCVFMLIMINGGTATWTSAAFCSSCGCKRRRAQQRDDEFASRLPRTLPCTRYLLPCAGRPIAPVAARFKGCSRGDFSELTVSRAAKQQHNTTHTHTHNKKSRTQSGRTIAHAWQKSCEFSAVPQRVLTLSPRASLLPAKKERSSRMGECVARGTFQCRQRGACAKAFVVCSPRPFPANLSLSNCCSPLAL